MSNFPGGADRRSPPRCRRAIANGYAAGAHASPLRRRSALSRAAARESQGDLFLITYPSPVLGDGRGANKPWLQELPDPVTKICWSSWVEMHPETAQRLGIERGDIRRSEDGERHGPRAGLPVPRHSQGRDRDPARPGTQGHGADGDVRSDEAPAGRHAVGLRPLRARHRRQCARSASRSARTPPAASSGRRRRRRSRRPAIIARCRAPKVRRASTAAASRRRSTRRS